MEAPPRYTLPDWQRIYRPAPALPPLSDGEAVLVVRPDDPVFAETLGRESVSPMNRADVAYTRHVTRLREVVDIEGDAFVLLGQWDAMAQDAPFEDAWAFYRAPSRAIEALLAMSGIELIPAVASLAAAPAPVEALAEVIPIETRLFRAPPPVVSLELDQIVRLFATGTIATDDAVLELALEEPARLAILETLVANVPDRYKKGIDLRTHLPVPGTKAFEKYLDKFAGRIFVHGTAFSALQGEDRAAAVRQFVEAFHVPQARPSLPPALRPKTIKPSAAAPRGGRRSPGPRRRRRG